MLSAEIPRVPVTYRVLSGNRPVDMLFEAAWSDKMVAALESRKATGYRTYPIEVYHKNDRILGYQGVKIVGRGGPLDEERSEMDRGSSGCILGHSGIYMDEAQWDGSDVFTIPGLGICVFVVEHVAEALQAACLNNVELALSSECRFGTKDPPPEPPPT